MKNAHVHRPDTALVCMGGKSSRKLQQPLDSLRRAGPFGIPRLLLSESGLDTGWWKAFAVIASPQRIPKHQDRKHFVSRNFCQIRVLPPFSKVTVSALVHVSLFFFLVRVPFSYRLLRQEDGRSSEKSSSEHYSLRYVRLADVFPVFSSAGRTGKNGPRGGALQGSSSAYHPVLRIVSRPPRLDNRHRTIIQSGAPPDLRLTVDPNLPNLFIAKQPEVARPTLKLGNSRPLVRDRGGAAVQVPQGLVVQGVPANASVLIPLGEAQNPHVPAPPPERVSTSGAQQFASREEGAPGSNPSHPGEILVLTTEPGNLSNLSQLPNGSQFGLLSLSPRVGPEQGSGGSSNGSAVHSGNGAGPAGSNAHGPGGNGGGDGAGIGGGSGEGGTAGVALPGIVGGPEKAGGSTRLTGEVASMIFAVKRMPNVRRNSLVVSTGPIGGGGLGVYGVLRGGRVYTVFLPMPGKNWILQYSRRQETSPSPRTDSESRVIKLEIAVAPPDPEEQFDFTRTQVSPEKKKKLIVLHGTIQEDGSVGALEVYQGVDPRMDRAALAAFQRWKFKPALRDNRPISIEILVGIPVFLPGA